MSRRLNLHEYEQYKEIAAQGYPFYGLLAAAMAQADTDNLSRLRAAFPDIHESLKRRYNAPLGVVEEWDGMTPEAYYDRLSRDDDDHDEPEDLEPLEQIIIAKLVGSGGDRLARGSRRPMTTFHKRFATHKIDYLSSLIRKCEQEIEQMYRHISLDNESGDEERIAIWVPFYREYIDLMENHIERISNYQKEVQ